MQAAQTEKVIKKEVDLALETPIQIDERDVTASVLGPGDEKIASELEKDREGKYHVKFVPIRPGQYKIFVRYSGELVEGAPYIVNVADKVNILYLHTFHKQISWSNQLCVNYGMLRRCFYRNSFTNS